MTMPNNVFSGNDVHHVPRWDFVTVDRPRTSHQVCDSAVFEFVEKVVDLVRQYAPDAAIAFNRSPEDCADAALRWLR